MVVEARSFPLHFGVELHRLRPRPEVTCSRGTHAQVATSLLKGGFVAFLQLECCSCDRAATELGVARRYFDQAWKVTAYLSRAIFAEAKEIRSELVLQGREVGRLPLHNFHEEDGGLWQKISLHRAPAPWRFGLETRDWPSVADSHLTGLGGVPSLV